MRKLLLVPALFLFLTLASFLSPASVSAQSCIPDYQSCDQNNPCCNFPSSTCQGGYCQPASAACGTNTLPCCDPPNPQCGPGLECIGNYCVQPPTCGDNGQSCCSGNTCNVPGLICLAGICVADPGGFCGGQGEPCCTAQGQSPCGTGLECSPTSNTCQLPSGGGSGGTGGGGTGGGGANITCNGGGGINTAIGCLSFTDTTSLLTDILTLGIGIGGGIAFILMLVAGFQIMTSTGNPDRLRAGQELLTSAIAGLILLVFSVFILRVIGIDILGISGLEQL